MWLGVACGAALGFGGIVAVEAGTGAAEAQGGFTVTPGQLRINQKISQAAVRRSNEALNLLRPVRSAPGQQASEKTQHQSSGVLAGTGTGWAESQLSQEVRQKLDAEGPAGPQGPQGPQGSQGPPGPSFGDGRQVANVNDIACDTDVVVGTLPVTLATPSRMWVHGHGTLRRGESTATTFTLFVRLRDAGDTTTLAASVPAVDAVTEGAKDDIMPLASSGILQTGEPFEGNTPVFTAPPGNYLLQLVANAGQGGPCVGQLPDFGYNQAAAFGYMLVGTG